jgi:DNA-binding transcriptional LysR family regulator
MPDLALDLRHLRDAILVAQHGSLRRAAESADVSQSTLSRRVQALERRLGIVLFERLKTGCRPTLAGEQFLRDAAFGAEHLHRVVRNIAFVRRGVIGSLRIGVIGSLARGPLAELLTIYHRQFPDIEVKVTEGNSQAHAISVLNGRLDAAVFAGKPQLPGCESRHLYDDALFVALPANHASASRISLTWRDLWDETLLVTADGPGPELEGIIMRRISSLGFRPKIVTQQVGRDNLLNMVGKGYGITLVVDSTCGVSYPGVRFVPVQPSEIVPWSVVWPTQNANPALKRFLELSFAALSSTPPNVC